MRTFLNEQNDQREDEDLAEHGADLWFEDLVGDAQAEGRHDATGQLADAAEYHHQERVDDVALAEIRADVADLAERHATKAGDTRAEPEGHHVHTAGGHAAASGHVAVLGDGAHVEAQAGLVQQQPGQRHHGQGEADDHDAVVRQHQVGQHLDTAGQPVGVGHFDVLRTEQHAHQLDQDQADAPGGEQGFQWPAVEVTNHRALQGHADDGGHAECHRQCHQWVQRQGLGGVALEQDLHHVGGIGAEHQHLAVGHVDHPEQAEGDGQAKRGEQQDRAQAHAAEGLTEQLADQQLALDLRQAGLRCSAYRSVTFHARVQQVFQARARQWLAGLAEQAHGGHAYRRVGVDQLQVGQGQGQGVANGVVVLPVEALGEQRQLRRLGALLQLHCGGEALRGCLGQQLMAGLGVGNQATQAIVQAQFARVIHRGSVTFGSLVAVVGFNERGLFAIRSYTTLLQGVEQRLARQVGHGGPAFQQFGLLRRAGSHEVGRIASLGGEWHYQQQAEK